MTPVQIATQIKALYADLKTSLTSEDGPWEGGYQALLSSLGDAHTASAETLERIAQNVSGMGGGDWAEVSVLTNDAAGDLRYLAATLQSAATHAEYGQQA